MKKYLLSFGLLVACALNANAGIEYGVTAGYNLTSMKLDRSTLTSTIQGKNGSGWYIGPKVNIDLIMGLSLEAAGVYNQREYKFANVAGVSLTETAKSLDFPINAKFTFPVAAVGVYVSTGPQFSFALGNKEFSLSNLFSAKNGYFKRENLTTTWNVGAGVRLMKHLEVGLSYNMPLGKTGSAVLNTVGVPQGHTEVPEYKANTFSVQASYYF